MDLHLPYTNRGRALLAAGAVFLAAIVAACLLTLGGTSGPTVVVDQRPVPIPFSKAKFCHDLAGAKDKLVAIPDFSATSTAAELRTIAKTVHSLHRALVTTSNYAKASPVKQTFFSLAPDTFWVYFYLKSYAKTHGASDLAKAQSYATRYNQQFSALTPPSLATGPVHCGS